MKSIRSEIVEGSAILRQLIERDARGELVATNNEVIVGSLYLVGGNLLGFLPAEMMQFPGSYLVEERPENVIFRSNGDVNANGNAGGLLFGVHYFRKNQLHTFKKVEKKI